MDKLKYLLAIVLGTTILVFAQDKPREVEDYAFSHAYIGIEGVKFTPLAT